MRVLIIEDEITSGKTLTSHLHEYKDDFQVYGPLVSIHESVEWLMNHAAPDLIFMDIQLGDGLSFEIFDELELNAPIIFVTAYDEYALRAFEVNSVAYLLKPISKEQVWKALDKYNLIHSLNRSSHLFDQLSWQRIKYKQRFLVKRGTKGVVVGIQDVVLFEKSNDLTFLVDHQRNRYVIEFTLTKLMTLVNPERFFRINRQQIVSRDTIGEIVQESNTLRIQLTEPLGQELSVSQRNVSAFKSWLK